MALNIDNFIDEFIAAQKTSGVDFPVIEVNDPVTGDLLETIDTEAVTREKLIPFVTELFHHSTKDVISKTSDFTMTADEAENQVILADATTGDIAITLPAPSTTAGKSITVKRLDSTVNRVRILEDIDGLTFYDLLTGYDAQEFVSDGTQYWTVNAPSIVQKGSKTFTASSSEAVIFDNAMPSTAYQITVEASGNPGGGVWITTKTTAGFTINFSGSVTLTALWEART